MFSRGTHRAFGELLAPGRERLLRDVLHVIGDLDRDEQPERLRLGPRRAVAAHQITGRRRERPALQVSSDEVERGLLRPAADAISLPRHPEASRVRHVLTLQRDPDHTRLRAAVAPGRPLP